MTSTEVLAWLEQNRLSYWVPKFKECADSGFEIDGDTLRELDETALAADFADTKVVARRKLLAKIRLLDEQVITVHSVFVWRPFN